MTSHDSTRSLLEPLEKRHLLSAELGIDGELVVIGTAGSDEIVIEAGEAGAVSLFGVDGVEDGTVFEGVDALSVFLLPGHDVASVSGDLRDTGGSPMGVSMFGGFGWDQLTGSGADDLLIGGPGRDAIRGMGGDDVVFGRQHRDWMYGGAGDDDLVGNLGPDVIFGGPGNDRLWGSKGHDWMFGGVGADSMLGQLGFDRLFAGAGDDVARGGGHADELRGGLGNDTLFGGWGHDDLFGGAGGGELVGGRGIDRFHGQLAERQDFVQGDAFFNAGLDDQALGHLGDDFWTQVDELDAQGAITSDMWIVINGSQTLLAECAHHLEDAERAFDALNELEIQQILIQAIPLVEELLGTFDADFGSDSMNDAMDIMSDFADILPQDVRTPVQAALDCLEDHQSLLDEMAAAMERIESEGEVPEVLWSGFGAVPTSALSI